MRLPSLRKLSGEVECLSSCEFTKPEGLVRIPAQGVTGVRVESAIARPIPPQIRT